MDELKKYKHILLPLVVVLFAFYGIKAYHGKVSAETSRLDQQVSALQEVVKMNRKVVEARDTLAKTETALFEKGQDEFLSQILSYATGSNLVVLSSRKSVPAKPGRRSRRKRTTDKADGLIKEYAVTLDVLGNSLSLKDFLLAIDNIKKYVVVKTLAIEELSYEDVYRERYEGMVLKASVIVNAKAMEKVAL